MSQRDLEAVIGRAVLDEPFRHLLLAEPETALAEYLLTQPELAVLRSMDAESLDACAVLLESRIRWSLARNESTSQPRKEHIRSDI